MAKTRKRDWVWAVRENEMLLVFLGPKKPIRATNDWGGWIWQVDGALADFELCVKEANQVLSDWGKIGTRPTRVRFSVKIVKESPSKRSPKPRSKAR